MKRAAVLAILFAGCSPAYRVRFTNEDIQKAIIQPAKCAEQADGTLLCKDVKVILKSIRAN